jgi:hypothetical protein
LVLAVLLALMVPIPFFLQSLQLAVVVAEHKQLLLALVALVVVVTAEMLQIILVRQALLIKVLQVNQEFHLHQAVVVVLVK